jgi:hypothetical protein
LAWEKISARILPDVNGQTLQWKQQRQENTCGPAASVAHIPSNHPFFTNPESLTGRRGDAERE